MPWLICGYTPRQSGTNSTVVSIVLGFAFYPVFLVVGWFYNRQARQLEARFTSLVDPVSRRPDV